MFETLLSCSSMRTQRALQGGPPGKGDPGAHSSYDGDSEDDRDHGVIARTEIEQGGTRDMSPPRPSCMLDMVHGE